MIRSKEKEMNFPMAIGKSFLSFFVFIVNSSIKLFSLDIQMKLITSKWRERNLEMQTFMAEGFYFLLWLWNAHLDEDCQIYAIQSYILTVYLFYNIMKPRFVLVVYHRTTMKFLHHFISIIMSGRKEGKMTHSMFGISSSLIEKWGVSHTTAECMLLLGEGFPCNRTHGMPIHLYLREGDFLLPNISQLKTSFFH